MTTKGDAKRSANQEAQKPVPRKVSKALGLTKRPLKPRSRFPSDVLGDNVRALRFLRKLTQDGLAETMQDLEFTGWSRVTVSDVERANRITGVDELFGLAIALRTTVVKLLDPQFSGDEGPGIDIHFAYPEAFEPEDGRKLILSDEDPWRLERPSLFTYAQYRKHIQWTAAGVLPEDPD